MSISIVPAWPQVVKKILKGEPAGKVEMAQMMEYTVSRLIDAGAEIPAKLIDLEVFGGNCPVCKKPFKQRHVKNKWIEFSYYEPSCFCFPTCPLCLRSMHHEVLNATKYCPHCGPLRCFEKTERTEYNEDTGKKVKKIVRCPGKLVAVNSRWRCGTCGKEYGSHELYQLFHGKDQIL